MKQSIWFVSGLFAFLSLVVNPVFACSDEDTTEDTVAEPNISVVVYSTDIIISEVLPNPSTDETTGEFIELSNEGSVDVDLTGWILSDATTNEYVLDDTIAAGDQLAIYRSLSDIAVNNSGDSIELYNPNNELVNSIEFSESAPEDSSYALDELGDWQWTIEPTPGRPNLIVVSVTADDTNNDDTIENDVDSEDSNEANAEDSTDDTNTDTELAPSYDFSTTIELSELLPDPEGSDATDEWVELYNSDTKQVDLYGWQITDASHSYTISESLIIAGDSYALFTVGITNLSLNNSGETITLLDPANEVMDQVTYSAAPEGQSYMAVDSTWSWTTTPTPEDNNVLVLEEAEEEEAEITTTTTTLDTTTADVVDEPSTYSIAAVKQLPKGETITFTGIVNVTPDTFSSQYFYIQDETSGIQIYSSSKSFPTLTVGDSVQVTGKTSTINGEVKVNISAAEDVVMLTHDVELTPVIVTEYDEANLGQLVQVSGEVTNKSGSTITLDTSWQVYVKQNTDVSTTLFTVGELVAVVGVLIGSDDGIFVQPRNTSDVQLVTATADSTLALLSDTNLVSSAQAKTTATEYSLNNDTMDQTTSSSKTIWWLIGVVIIFGGGFILSRSAQLKTAVRNWIVARARALVTQSDHSVVSKKSTKGLSVQSRCRG